LRKSIKVDKHQSDGKRKRITNSTFGNRRSNITNRPSDIKRIIGKY
jgi:hypothetical protein